MNDSLHQQERIAARVKLIEPQIEGFQVRGCYHYLSKQDIPDPILYGNVLSCPLIHIIILLFCTYSQH